MCYNLNKKILLLCKFRGLPQAVLLQQCAMAHGLRNTVIKAHRGYGVSGHVFPDFSDHNK